MNDDQAFRSNDPEVVATWRAWRAEYAEFRTKLRDLHESTGRAPYFYNPGISPAYVVGLAPADTDLDDSPPEGWRVARPMGRATLVPDKRTKAGRVNADLLSSITCSGGSLPGMPDQAGGSVNRQGSQRIYSPAAFDHDGTVYVSWASDADLTDAKSPWGSGKTVDPGKWSPCLLSEYHAAREAEEAERQAVKP